MSWSLPGHLHLHTAGSRYCPDSFWASPRDTPAPWALPDSLGALPPRKGTESCVSYPPPTLLLPLQVPGLAKIPRSMDNCWPRDGG